MQSHYFEGEEDAYQLRFLRFALPYQISKPAWSLDLKIGFRALPALDQV